MNLKTVLALAIAAACAAPVLAQQAGPGPEAKDTNPAAPSAGATRGDFSAMDRNNDGYISRDEARDAPWSNRFTEMDKDNDSRLSLGEFDAMRQQGAAAAGGSGDKPARKE
ncbi:MAG TPA: hypothetical protein VNP36_07440 [Burkholderiales bacterium]|nr:hypothetical protein [Burkholderiales bacterium]